MVATELSLSQVTILLIAIYALNYCILCEQIKRFITTIYCLKLVVLELWLGS